MNKEPYAFYNKEVRNQMEDLLVEKMKKDFITKDLGRNLNRYTVCLQGVTFVAELYDDEMEKIAVITIEILEELKKMNNEGFDGVYAQRLREKVLEKHAKLQDIWVVPFWNEFATDRLKELVMEADVTCRVEGSYALLVSNPVLTSVICSVYFRLADHFDDLEIYLHSAYFLMRGIMKIGGEEVNE